MEETTTNLNVRFLNSFMDVPPPWAIELKEMVAQLLEKENPSMAKVEEKLQELQDAMGGIGISLEGISADLQSQNQKLTANAAEIEALKQAVLDAQGGNLSDADLQRFDALIQSVKDAAQKAAELDAALPNVSVEPDPTPTPPPEPTA